MQETLNVTSGSTLARTLIVAAGLLVSGCNVAAWGNLFVLGLTLALFCATLSLGRAAPASHRAKNPSDSGTQLS
jgi:hypothetical protein